ncbi:DUF2510 domain-containing protein [Glaciihabitans arcticus]|uniref:DUF2510 domain-containing protein n=1 Tax=Glaciihabitans arcticus TaxID=2668039 RepID=A0A4Q9GTG0_9MICO|nr:DUF2510 domain-containing protein [Glaciihabitans arcticus]TBN56918.1 DUF2510 domain-containing protein [Glaciihabitans arcticus]
MTDSNNSAPAGWFPDPSGTPRQRYWDGAQWTEHFHPPLTEPVAGPVATAPKSKGKSGLVALIAGGSVVILAVTSFFVWGLPALTGGSNGTVYADPAWDYSYTTPMLNIERDHEFEFPAKFDFEKREMDFATPEPAITPFPGETFEPGEEELLNSDPYVNPSWAFEIFYDAAFTKRAEVMAIQYEPGEPIFILPHDSPTGWTVEGHYPRPVMDEEFGGGWGLHSEYYLMRKIDEKGELLDKPVVTKFTAKSELAAPVVTFSTEDDDGNLTMTWDPVDGADRYLVVASHSGGSTTTRSLDILDQSETTTWSSSISQSDDSRDAPWVNQQNVGMELFSYGSADTLSSGWSLTGDTNGYDFGVIASNGTNFSPYNTYDSVEIAGTLPLEIAFAASRELKKWGKSGFVEGMENVQTTIAFTSLDGATRSTVAHIVADKVFEIDGRWALPLMGRGTSLGEWVPVSKATVPDIDAAVKAYNKRADDEAPTTGMTEFVSLTEPVDQFATGVKEAPDTEYPIFGSNDFSKFLAAHFIAHTPIIDISEWIDKPGMPEAMDAAYEAMYQNPYAISLKGMQVNNAGTAMTVEYTFTKKVMSQMQSELFAKVKKVVKDVASSGSDAKKVTALNNWIVKNAAYDHKALANKDKGFFGAVPVEYANAWNANGVLVDGVGVCASYAYAFNALANDAGIETVVIVGDVVNGGLHAWNKVKIDGTWTAVDSTWNDSPAGNRYLMITDAEFSGSALRTEDQSWMSDTFLKDFSTQ